MNFILLFALPYYHGAVHEARGRLEAGRGTLLRRADARRPTVPHRNVHLEAVQVDAPHRPRADPRPLRRALRRPAQKAHRKGGLLKKNVASIEVVIQKFLVLADAKVQEAQEKADRAVAVDVGDVEASETPEIILLGAVSGDQSKDRTDRALVTLWLKSLGELPHLA